MIIEKAPDYEFRTTVVKTQLQKIDFENIGKLIKGAKKYYLQKFIPTKTLNKEFLKEQTYSDLEFAELKKTMQKFVDYFWKELKKTGIKEENIFTEAFFK